MKNLFAALAKFQSECPDLHKDSDGYGYKYIELPNILKVVTPILHKHKLALTQICDLHNVQTILCHWESGETLNSSIEIPQGVQLAKMNAFQVLGSAISYLRRYQIEMILGISATKDTDAAGEQVSAPQTPAQSDDNRPWFNVKDKAGNYTTEGQKAFDAIANGTATIAAIEKKYKLSKDTKAELIKAVNIFEQSNRP